MSLSLAALGAITPAIKNQIRTYLFLASGILRSSKTAAVLPHLPFNALSQALAERTKHF
jgi:hypothetical protein